MGEICNKSILILKRGKSMDGRPSLVLLLSILLNKVVVCFAGS